MVKDFILASSSPQRIALLKQIDFEPLAIEPANIDETPLKNEKPSQYVKRIAKDKALAVSRNNAGKIVLSADTVIVVGTKIIQKAKNSEEQTKIMQMLSGRTHYVLTGVCVIDAKGKIAIRFDSTKIKTKRLSLQEINEYVSSQEWQGCAGYKIEGLMGGFVEKIIGSYSGVVGLPLCVARNLLIGAGVK